MHYRATTIAAALALLGTAWAGEQKGKPVEPGAVVTAKSVTVIEAESGKVLWSRQPNAKRFPASTTKVLTTLLLLENCRRDDLVTSPSEVETIEGSSLHLRPGEQLSAWDLAYGLIVRSANDGSYAAAMHLAGSISAFSDMMNARAKQIGCTNSHFANPSGLPDPNHYTSSHDLALIAREAMRLADFRTLAATHKVQIKRSMNQEDTWLISKNKYLEWDPTTEGIKTGYTAAAGHCFVGSATRKGFRVITVVLGSKDWKADYKALTDWAFANYSRAVVAPVGSEVGRTPVSDGAAKAVSVEVKEPVYYADKTGAHPKLEVTIEPAGSLRAPIERGAPVGVAVYRDGSGWEFRVPVMAAESVSRPSLIARAGSAHWSFYTVACLLGFSAYVVRRKARRMTFHAGRR